MFTFRNLSLTLCVIFFITSSNLSAQDTPPIREIFADSTLRQKLLDETIYKDDQPVPNLLLNNVFQVAVNRACNIEDLGEFSVVEFRGTTGSQRTQKDGPITLVTNGERGKLTTYYTMQARNLFIQWCDDAEDVPCCRVYDSYGNVYGRNGFRSWMLMKGKGIDENELKTVLQILLSK